VHKAVAVVVPIAVAPMIKQRHVQMLSRFPLMDAQVVPAAAAVVAHPQPEALLWLQVMEMPAVVQIQIQWQVAVEEKDQPVTLVALHRIQVREEMAQLQQSLVQHLLMQVAAAEVVA
jgi:hypothetical protein